MTYESLVEILLTINSTLFSNFCIEKIASKIYCNFFVCECYAQKFAKNLQKFLLTRLFQIFPTILVEVKDIKIEICIIISGYSSNIAAIRLKICTKQSQGKFFRILDTFSFVGNNFAYNCSSNLITFLTVYYITFEALSSDVYIKVRNNNLSVNKLLLCKVTYTFFIQL